VITEGASGRTRDGRQQLYSCTAVETVCAPALAATPAETDSRSHRLRAVARVDISRTHWLNPRLCRPDWQRLSRFLGDRASPCARAIAALTSGFAGLCHCDGRPVQRIPPPPPSPRRIRSPLTRACSGRGFRSAREGRVLRFSESKEAGSPSVASARGRRPTRWCRVTFPASTPPTRGCREPTADHEAELVERHVAAEQMRRAAIFPRLAGRAR